MLSAVRIPGPPPPGVGLPARLGPVVVAAGEPAWAWGGAAPDLPIDTFDVPAADPAADWGVDHVVVTSADVEETSDALVAVGADLRRHGHTARGGRAAFLLAGVLVEVVEVGGGPARLAGIAYETRRPLDEVVAAWRAVGVDAGDPHPAVQSGRSICSVRGAAIAVMTPR
ncbi:MAG: hypothetical protein AB1Z57_05795 [Acidimicrobiia bacterium]